MKRLFLLFFLAALISKTQANNIQVSNVSYNDNTRIVSFDLSWENSWNYGPEYHDAAWVFIKYNSVNAGKWLHGDLDPSFGTSSDYDIEQQADKKGVFVKRKALGKGHNGSSQIQLKLDNVLGLFPDIQVFAIEMVMIPQGAFYMGDSHDSAHVTGSEEAIREKLVISKQGNTKKIYRPYLVNSEAGIQKSKSYTDSNGYTGTSYFGAEAGSIRTWTDSISAKFPKAYNAYYCMKYDVSLGQLVAFLNNLTRQQQEFVIPNLASKTVYADFPVTGSALFENTNNNGIRCDSVLPSSGPIHFFVDCNLNRIEGDDDDGVDMQAAMPLAVSTAYLCWSALRPMTEFEFEKACRGPLYPTSKEMANGNSKYSNLFANGNGVVDLYKPTMRPNKPGTYSSNKAVRCGMLADSTTNRFEANAGYWGVMDLTLGVSVAAVSVNDPIACYNFDHTNGAGNLELNKGDSFGFGLNGYIARPFFNYDQFQVSARFQVWGLAAGLNSVTGCRGVRSVAP